MLLNTNGNYIDLSSDKLPEIAQTKLWLIYGTGKNNQGRLAIVTHDLHQHSPEYDGIILGEMIVTMNVPTMEVNAVKEKMVASLRQQRADRAAEHFMELKEIDDQIQSLLAIEYNPTEQ